MSLHIARSANGYVLTQKQVVPASLEVVWAFFSNAENLEQLTPPFLRFKILTPCPIEMKPGTLIDYRIKLFGVPLRWRTHISECHEPQRFVDEQIRGPYSRWHHEHSFVAVDGGTEITDRVEYRLPLRGLGQMVHRVFIHRTLSDIFTYRASTIDTIFSSEPP
jgi:hypothetical protein